MIKSIIINLTYQILICTIYLIWIDDLFKFFGVSDEARVFANKYIIYEMPAGFIFILW